MTAEEGDGLHMVINIRKIRLKVKSPGSCNLLIAISGATQNTERT